MSGHQGHDHSHAAVTEGNAKKLTIALILTTTFLIIEFIVAIEFKNICKFLSL